MTLMVFAAGEGTRFRPQTEVLPKPSIPLLRVPLAFWGVNLFGSLPISNLVVNTYHLSDEIKRTFRSSFLQKFQITFSDEKEMILGSGGGLLNAKRHLPTEESFFVINGDEFILPKDPYFLENALKFHNQEQNLITMITTQNDEVGKKFGGVWVDEQNNILGFGKEKISGSTEGQHNVGLMIINPKFFKYFDDVKFSNILYDHAVNAIKSGEKLMTYPQEMVWFETGNKEDFLTTTSWCMNQIQQNTNAGKMISNFVQKVNPDAKFFAMDSGLLLADKDFDTKQCSVKGFAVLGKMTEVSRPCEFNRSVVHDNIMLAKSSIQNEIILR